MINEGILRKAESAYGKEPWTITTVHTNGTIRIQRGTKTERQISGEYNHLRMIFFKLGITIKLLTFLLLSQKSYAYLIVILSLHLSRPPGSCRLIFFLIKGFFLHDFYV